MIPWNTSRLAALFDDVVRVEIELWDAADARLRADAGLTAGRFQVMRVIAARPGCRVQDIAAELAVTVGGISKLVDRIEAAGHCARTANPADKRSSLIELTPAGRAALTAAEESFGDEMSQLLGGVLPDGDLDRLAGTLATLRTALSGRNPR